MSDVLYSQLYLLDILSRAKQKERKRILESSTYKLIKSIVECIENVLRGNVKLDKNKFDKLKRYKNVLRRIRSGSNKWKHKKQIIVQQGGSFLPSLVTPIVSVLSNNITTK